MNKLKSFLIFIFFLFCIVSAIAWTPPSDANFRNVYALRNMTEICFNSSCISSWSGTNSSWNESYADTLYTRPGDCAAGQAVQNTTNSGVECINVTTTAYTAEEDYIYLNGTVFRFNQTRNNNTIETIGNATYIKLTSESDLNVNSSNSATYWNGANAFSDINAGDITDDGTYVKPGDLGNTSPIGLSGFIYSLIACGNGEGYYYNTTLGAWECKAPAGGGTVTSITSGVGMNFSEITSTGSIDINVTYFNTNYYNQTEADNTFINQDSGTINASQVQNFDIACPANYFAQIINMSNESVTCVESTNGNTSWNKSYADTLYAPISTVTDNTSWNESYADTLYAPISTVTDNTSWNESYADTLYASLGGDQEITLAGENITSGTVASARIEDAYLKNTGDVGTGNYELENATMTTMYNNKYILNASLNMCIFSNSSSIVISNNLSGVDCNS